MGIVSEPWGEGKGLVATNYRDTSGDRGWTEGQGRQSEPPEGRRKPEGTHATVPPRVAGRRPERQRARDGRTHEVSNAGAGIWPGRRTATRRSRPAWHTGHRVMSTPVSRSIRAATGSGPVGAGGSIAASPVCPGVLPSWCLGESRVSGN